MTTSQQQQALLIAGEFNKFERNSKENFARLSALATNLLNQFKSIQIQKWDPGKYYLKIIFMTLV